MVAVDKAGKPMVAEDTKGYYKFDRKWGFTFNEGGRGLIVTFIWSGPLFFYACFWTKWIAPRIVIANWKIDLSCYV